MGESLKETVAANSEEVELRRKLETLQNENNELEDALKRAGSDKLHAMARLNNELEHLRGHVKRLQERKRGGPRKDKYNRESSPASTVQLSTWTWGDYWREGG